MSQRAHASQEETVCVTGGGVMVVVYMCLATDTWHI